jgi:hypothetical protein
LIFVRGAMCNDPSSPNPGAFCCMRGTGIAVIVFGVIDLAGVAWGIPGLGQAPPCFICPNGKVNYQTPAGGLCDRGGITYDSHDPANTLYSDADSCTANSGTWTAQTCAEMHQRYQNQRQGNDASVPNDSADASCSARQAEFALEGCCDATGDPPLDTTAQNTIGWVLGLLQGLFKLIAGSLLSCCFGVPTPGKMKSAMVLAGLAALLDFVGLIFAFFGIARVTDPDFVNERGGTAQTFFLAILVVWIILSLINIAVSLSFVFATRSAGQKGIGKAEGIGGVPSI